ncbi:MAG: S1 RNA-binding domain-containing protein [Candidatus Micrarchaeota archaeon]
MSNKVPEVDELVVAVIKKIMPYGAFCVLPEYDNIEAFLHVSEVAPRWIKNIHEFISEGGTHVVKIYRLDREKNQIDVSLKRVTDQEKNRKLEASRQKKRADKLLSLATEKTKVDIAVAQAAIEKEFEDVYSCFAFCSEEGMDALKNIDLPEAFKIELVDLAKKNLKKASVDIAGLITVQCYEPDGIERIKKTLELGEGVSISYFGAPNYRVSITEENFKLGEKKLMKIIQGIISNGAKNKCEVKFTGMQE